MDLRKRIERLSSEERHALACRISVLRGGARGNGAHGGDGRELVAYVVPGARPIPSPGVLREFLRQTLPE